MAVSLRLGEPTGLSGLLARVQASEPKCLSVAGNLCGVDAFDTVALEPVVDITTLHAVVCMAAIAFNAASWIAQATATAALGRVAALAALAVIRPGRVADASAEWAVGKVAAES